MTTPLADALVAAQRRALDAVQKQYAAGRIEADAVRDKLNAVGLTDTVDQDRLVAALDTIMEYGAPLPAEPAAPTNGEKPPEKATDAQRALIKKLVVEKNVPAPDYEPLSKQDAHAIIDSLKAGTYDPVRWSIPF